MIKIDENIKLKKFNLKKFDFVFNHFKELICSYEDLTQVNLDTVLNWEKNKILNKYDSYNEIYYNNNFVGVVRFVDKNDYYDLDDFYIDEKFRNKGIGSKVLNYFINVAKQQNKPIELCVFKSNKAIELYKKFNFKLHNDLGTRVILRLYFN